MTSLRASEVGRRLDSVEKLPGLILAFGPDRGLVTEVSAAIAKLFALEADDPFAVVKLDAATIASDPLRLVDEVRTISLFGGRRLVVVRDGAGRNLDGAVTPLLEHPPTDAVVVVEAGDLKKGVGLRKKVEDDRTAVAIYCPQDGVRDLERMVDEEAASLGLTVETDARAALVERLGGDRAASRNEVLKVCLYAMESGRVTLEDVGAVVGDISTAAMTEAVDAAFLGRRETLDVLLARLLRQDTAAPQLLGVALRASQSLEVGASEVAGGTAANRVVEGLRPPVYGARKAAVARMLERWSPPALRTASAEIAAATFRTRMMPQLSAALARDTMLRIAAQEGR